jgi:hypothetical protein
MRQSEGMMQLCKSLKSLYEVPIRQSTGPMPLYEVLIRKSEGRRPNIASLL